MHDLNTIRRLNVEAHEKAITSWRNQGKYVLSVYDGLTLVSAEPFDTQPQVAAAAGRVNINSAVGLTINIIPPFPPEQRINGQRDQSEDRPVSFETADDYLAFTGQKKYVTLGDYIGHVQAAEAA